MNLLKDELKFVAHESKRALILIPTFLIHFTEYANFTVSFLVSISFNKSSRFSSRSGKASKFSAVSLLVGSKPLSKC